MEKEAICDGFVPAVELADSNGSSFSNIIPASSTVNRGLKRSGNKIDITSITKTVPDTPLQAPVQTQIDWGTGNAQNVR